MEDEVTWIGNEVERFQDAGVANAVPVGDRRYSRFGNLRYSRLGGLRYDKEGDSPLPHITPIVYHNLGRSFPRDMTVEIKQV